MFFDLCQNGKLTKNFVSFFLKKGFKKEKEKENKHTILDLSLFNKKVDRDLVKFLIFHQFFFKSHLNKSLIETANKEVIWEGEWKENLQYSGRGLIKMGMPHIFNF
jgi:hypothetical protein